MIGLANAEEPRHHCISVGFVHNPPEITVNAYGHRLSAIFRALSRKRSSIHLDGFTAAGAQNRTGMRVPGLVRNETVS